MSLDRAREFLCKDYSFSYLGQNNNNNKDGVGNFNPYRSIPRTDWTSSCRLRHSASLSCKCALCRPIARDFGSNYLTLTID